MKLTRAQFDDKFKNNQLHLAFVGMSNIGKSFWTAQLTSNMNFSFWDVDNEMWKIQGFATWEEAAKWMGYPFAPQYPRTQQEYLDMEKKLTICQIPDNKNFVLDTTGSVIYHDAEVLNFLKEKFLIIDFDASQSMLKMMAEEFFIKPKTIVWGDNFNQQEDEENIDSLRRCYPELLKYRIGKYRELADVIIPGEVTRSPDLSLDRFWEILRLSLPRD